MFVRSAKIKAHKLYNKYIAVGSEFEINISSNERNNLRNILSNLESLLSYNINITDLMKLFESCKNEMIALQSHSLYRFKYTNEYASIVLHQK